MESIQYDRFNSAEAEIISHHEEPPFTPNRWNRMIFITFGVFSLFLLILTITVGIKFTQINQQMSEIMGSVGTVDISIKEFQKKGQKVNSFYPEPEIPVRGPCEEDWLFHKDKCYYISRLMKKWEDAQQNCVLHRAHLLVVNDKEEMDFISQVVDMNLNYWIGLVERDTEGSWTWVDGTDFNKTEHFWDEGQPDDWHVRVNGEDCGQIHGNIVPGKWNDADCTLFNRYICEGLPRKH